MPSTSQQVNFGATIVDEPVAKALKIHIERLAFRLTTRCPSCNQKQLATHCIADCAIIRYKEVARQLRQLEKEIKQAPERKKLNQPHTKKG